MAVTNFNYRKPAFAGFPAEGLKFLRALKRNNRRDWFQPRKEVYEQQVRAPMLELVAAIDAAMMKFAPEYITEPARAVFRIYRDTRFSKNKAPYKTHIAASFARRGIDKQCGAGLYFSVAPEQVEVAAGLYMPGPEQTRAVREHLLEHHQELRRILGSRTLRTVAGSLWGEQLTRAPKGFDPDHPAADLFRYKQWVLDVELDPALAAAPHLLDEILKRFRVMAPFVEFLNQPLLRKPRMLFGRE